MEKIYISQILECNLNPRHQYDLMMMMMMMQLNLIISLLHIKIYMIENEK